MMTGQKILMTYQHMKMMALLLTLPMQISKKQILIDSLYPTEEITIATWLYSDNWLEEVGDQIVGNHYRGGYGFFYATGTTTRIFSVYDRTHSHYFILNSDGRLINNRVFDTFDEVSDSARIVVDRDYYTWLFDNDPNNNVAYKIDNNGIVETSVVFPSAFNFDEVAVDGDNNVWMLDITNQQISGMDSFGTVFSGYDTGTFVNQLDVNRDNEVITVKALDMVIDNNNAVWLVFGLNIYKDGEIVFHLNEPSPTSPRNQITCDGDNNIWALHRGNQVVKLNNDGALLFNFTLDAPATDANRTLDFSREIVDGEYVDFAWIIQENNNTIYKYSMNGVFVDKFSVLDLFDIVEYPDVDLNNVLAVADGDFTGYQLKRKFEFSTRDNRKPVISGRLRLINPADETDIVKVDMIKDTVELSPGWHHFAMTYNWLSGNANYYVDTELVETTTVSPSTYEIGYSYKNPILIGATVGRNGLLEDELLLNEFPVYGGKIDDLRIYANELSNFDILAISREKQEFKPLIWNMPTGTQNYVEEVERFFKHKLPGQKSHLYNIRIANLDIDNEDTRNVIEQTIRNTIDKVTPAYTELYKINWE
jgi:hypothetical protein